MYKEGKQDLVREEEPLKEREFFKDHVMKPVQTRASVQKEKGETLVHSKDTLKTLKQNKQFEKGGQGKTRAAAVQASAHFRHCRVEFLPLSKVFYTTIVYASNHRSERKELWRDLLQIQPPSSEAWNVWGDFNCVLATNERYGCGLIHPNEIEDFVDYITKAGLVDLQFSGSFFTWNKTEGNTRKGSKLDRCLVNMQWSSIFPATTVEFKKPFISDHSPIQLSWFVEDRGSSPFRFNNAWTLHPAFMNLVEDNWITSFSGNPVYVLSQKLKVLKGILKHWAKEHFSNINGRVVAAKENMLEIQGLLEADPHDTMLINSEKEARSSYADLIRMEFEELKQKTNCTWMLKGDKCTTYFHGILKERKSRNKIWTVCDTYGNKITDRDAVQSLIVDHYSHLLDSDNEETTDLNSIDEMQVIHSLNEEDALDLLKDIKDDEIKACFFDINNYKSPGPDGFSALFYKFCWRVVGDEEGGLNLLDLKLWNKAAYCGLVFKVAAKDDNLWVMWVWAHHIKEWNFWSMEVPSECSWVWRNILLMRKTAVQFIQYRIANDITTSLWFDPWCKGQVRWDNMEARAQLIFPSETTVSELIENGQWKQFIHQLPQGNLKQDILNVDVARYLEADKVIWMPSPQGNFSSHFEYSALRITREKVL
ncbi:Dnase i-like superfamily protein [Thalictrum thalictroides]|uniref:Dnase i-like superfamily protein n=1 Tax=Thalictrum thalictroides TaxID=46969 RepID=A0A7J6VLN0_THATH|nr:Dnase i-like superfamily protein [Thalictrum thalictroides]